VTTAKPKPAKKASPNLRAHPASREAQRLAAVILEVLAGVRTPPDAAAALSISLPKYYLWERRALVGLVSGCEPRSAAKGPGPEQRIALLEKELARMRVDCARQHALVRAAQRTIGLGMPLPLKPAPKAADKATGNGSAKVKRKRRPVARALRLAADLRAASSAEEIPDGSPSVPQTEVLQRIAMSTQSSPAVVPRVAGAATGG
jgi:hypothetical protein